MNGLLFDTHIWLWAQRNELSHFTREFVQEAERRQALGEVFLSAISILEFARLVADGDYTIADTVDEFVAAALSDGGLRLVELSPQILIESTRLPGTFHRDPADRLLVATAREHNLTLITVDRDILQYAARGHLNARKP
ncbi:MAG TPA: type II toxin-antitoxin system VapC family toxin [Acidobacteriaceae bacterium]